MGGQHRAQRAGVIGSAAVVSAALAIGVAGPAMAAPVQPGSIGDSGAQPGSVPQSEGAQPGSVAPAPAPEQPRTYWVAPPQEYNQIQWQQAPDYSAPSTSTDDSTNNSTDNSGGSDNYSAPSQQEQYVAPVTPQELHAPAPTPLVAPIQAPEKTLRLGDFEMNQPNWMSDEYLDRTNNQAAVIEAQVNQGWQSIGVPVSRSNRVAAATVGGAATGALAGANAVGIPGAVVGGLIGGTIGGIGGAAMGGFVPVPVPGVLPLTTGVVGTAAGAAIGAAVVGVPAATVGAVAGGLAGGVAGAAFGAGDMNATPRKVAAPDLPAPNTDAITAQVHDQVAALPAPVQQFVKDSVASAEHVGGQVNNQAAAVRGGNAGINGAATEAGYAFGPVGDLIGKAIGAATAGATK